MRKYLSIFLFAALGSTVVEAITFQQKDFDELTNDAEQIFIGTVSGISARKTMRGAIVTDYVFDSIEAVKGSVHAGVTVTMLGGTVDGESLEVGGAPTFTLGRRYLLFVSGNGSVMFPLVGGEQGIFQIRTDAITTKSYVYDYGGRPVTELRSARSGVVKQAESSSSTLDEKRPITSPLTIETFVGAIRNNLER